MYRVPKNTISNFIKEVCQEIYNPLQEFMKVPQTEEEWKEIQNNFYCRWNFPNRCRVLDVKHIIIRNAPHSGSEYFNYKGTFTIILFASVDENYSFRYNDVSTKGRTSDAAVFSNSSLNAALQANLLNFPKNGVFVADDAFPLKTFILEPYGRTTCLSRKQKNFNYRLFRARRIVENAFGILASRLRIFEKSIPLAIDKVDILVKTACALHNWLRTTSSEKYTEMGALDVEDFNAARIIPGSWRSEIHEANGLQALRNNVGARNYT
ncbi:unnamed protein product [Acanthoscelides obtectus]|uniref:DDE Tnp4 domain-containing protein n=1 Tax=Acanthoscelides obtectus TaxID=200917 RepID=A0A9P0Q5F2_ACAOB|nr:unnamed protein product [Acanthoscelides obtectus]CAK1657526.1 Putative nuclease HARBI1 [Acanthoscelides obtectus]